MRKPQLVAACSSAVLVLAALAATAAEAPPAAPAPPVPALPEVRLPEQSQIDAQLQAAQKQLEQAAHEVARLSTQLSTTVLSDVMPLVAARPVIGVQLEAAPGNTGARVREVSPGGPAAEAGLRPGDVILALNGTELRGEAPARQVSDLLRELKPDTRVTLRVQREGQPLTLSVTPRGGELLAGLPRVREFSFETAEGFGHRALRDMELATLTPALGSYFGTDKGVLVVRAPADGALSLKDGDVILAIDGREPTSGSHATRILGSYQAGEKITLRIMRQHKTQDLQATLPDLGRQRDGRRREAELPQAGADVTAHLARRAAPPG